MSVGFSFSDGNSVKAVELVGTVIDALRSIDEAREKYHELDN